LGELYRGVDIWRTIIDAGDDVAVDISVKPNVYWGASASKKIEHTF
jgi:hypothetical protein